jgi:hypothetical protein
MGGLLMIAALPLMLLGGLALDVLSNDDGDDAADEEDQVVGDVPVGEGPPLV